jgi:hypothetical protein
MLRLFVKLHALEEAQARLGRRIAALEEAQASVVPISVPAPGRNTITITGTAQTGATIRWPQTS